MKTKNLFGEEINMPSSKEDEGYIYIAQNNREKGTCKIGKTIDLKERLKQYNHTTGKSMDNQTVYLFTCFVKSMKKMENAITEKFLRMREKSNREIYFFNEYCFNEYVKFIKESEWFKEEIFHKETKEKKITKIIIKTTPSLKERGETKKTVLLAAQKTKDNEFYTLPEDVEKEIEMYPKKIWENKTVFCNCDDAADEENHRSSAFTSYFLKNFIQLKLKKLICLHYAGGLDLFKQGPKGYIFTKKGFSEIGKKEFPKNFDGSFDHPISIKILNEEADIVCTNPPFTRAIEFWKLIVESGKKFLIISNCINPVATAYIPYFMDKKVWAGYNAVYEYLNPKKERVRAAGHWYTNLPVKNRPRYKNIKIMPLKDIPAKCQKRDDDDVLLLDNNYIPSDYKKSFAVSNNPILSGLLEKGFKIVKRDRYNPSINGKKSFSRILIQKEV